jgi:hypothetical protein
MRTRSQYLAAAAAAGILAIGAVVSPAVGDDPPPVVLGPPPLAADIDLRVWQVGTDNGAGQASSVGGTMNVFLTKSRPVARNVVRVCNIAPNPNRVKVRGTASTRSFRVRYSRSGRNITGAVVTGRFRTRRLLEDECVKIRMKVTRTAAAARGDRRRLTVRGTPKHEIYGPDRISVVAHAQKPPTTG